jgi:uncharacterized membrane protein
MVDWPKFGEWLEKLKELIKLVPILEEHPIGSLRLLKYLGIISIFPFIGIISLSFYTEFTSGMETEVGKLICNGLFILLILIILLFSWFMIAFLVRKDFDSSNKERIEITKPTMEIDFSKRKI